MGTWGAGIFSNDDALDARATFDDALARCQDIDEALATTLVKGGVSLESAEDGAFLLGLANHLHTKGWLTEGLRIAALKIIDSGKDAERFEDSLRAQRLKTLTRLRERLTSPMKSAARFPPKPPAPTEQLADFELGEIIARKLPNGRIVLMKVVEFAELKEWKVIAPVVVLLKWTSESMPTEAQAKQLPTLKLPLRPDGFSAFTKLSLAREDGVWDGFNRPNWHTEIGAIPKSGLTKHHGINRPCTLDQFLDYALDRWWVEPNLPADAPPPWLDKRPSA